MPEVTTTHPAEHAFLETVKAFFLLAGLLSVFAVAFFAFGQLLFGITSLIQAAFFAIFAAAIRHWKSRFLSFILLAISGFVLGWSIYQLATSGVGWLNVVFAAVITALASRLFWLTVLLQRGTIAP